MTKTTTATSTIAGTMTIATYTRKFRNVRVACNFHSRQATVVTLSDGRVIQFDEKLSKKEAVRQIEKCLARETNGAPLA
jgi:uncharacterized protein YceH (UPF0502 family)